MIINQKIYIVKKENISKNFIKNKILVYLLIIENCNDYMIKIKNCNENLCLILEVLNSFKLKKYKIKILKAILLLKERIKILEKLNLQ